jgi:tetratricopeptide (TPR) repeat protein
MRGSGDIADAIERLTHLLGRYPLNEPLVAALMQAMHTAGRTAQALEHFAAIRQRLADDLGVDPGPQLQQLHQAILRNELPSLAVAARVMPAQLPHDIAGFVGRHHEVAELDALLDPSANVRIVAVSGTAGIGKTALALRWAHSAADRFHDGVLHLDLRGFDQSGVALDPADALGTLLDGLGVPAARIPDEVDARSGLYRTTLSGKRVLVVLDNARDAEQVRPLLPAAAGCRTLVTSRDDLAGLVAVEGARLVTLAPLDEDDASSLLAAKIGGDRIGHEPDALKAILDRCAGLPLALAVAGARATTSPNWSLTDLAGQLCDIDAGLDAFASRDPRTDLRSVFSWSYTALPPAAQALFRLLALHPGPDIAVPAAASLTATEPRSARRVLDQLASARLVEAYLPGRYRLHELIRAYAAELLDAHDPPATRTAAFGRLLDHYLAAAHSANRLLDPQRESPPLPPPAPGVATVAFGSHEQARSWLRAEHPALAAIARQAARHELPAQAWQLSWHVAAFFERQGWWTQWFAIQDDALRLSERTGDRSATAQTYRDLGAACLSLRRLDEADRYYARALDLFSQIGDGRGQARVHLGLGVIASVREQFAEAVEHTERAYRRYAELDDQLGLARSHNNLGAFHTDLRQYRTALRHCRIGLRLHQALGDRRGESYILDSLGTVLCHLDRHRTAIGCFEAAIEASRDVGSRRSHAEALDHLGDAHHALGDDKRARVSWQEALEIFEQFSPRYADAVRTKLQLEGR